MGLSLGPLLLNPRPSPLQGKGGTQGWCGSGECQADRTDEGSRPEGKRGTGSDRVLPVHSIGPPSPHPRKGVDTTTGDTAPVGGPVSVGGGPPSNRRPEGSVSSTGPRVVPPGPTAVRQTPFTHSFNPFRSGFPRHSVEVSSRPQSRRGEGPQSTRHRLTRRPHGNLPPPEPDVRLGTLIRRSESIGDSHYR